MTLVVYPEGTQKSGSTGGTTHSRNRFGAYQRSRSMPVNPNTARQVAVRNAVRSITIAWDEILTPAQRSGWKDYGLNVNWLNKLGQSIHLTGLNMFVRSNTPRVMNTIARVDDAPLGDSLGSAELELAVTASEATQDLTVNGEALAPWVGAAGAWQFYFMGLPQKAGIEFFGGPYRQLRAVPGAGPPPFPQVIPTVFPFVEGQRIWVRSRIATGDGRLSNFAEVNFLAAA